MRKILFAALVAGILAWADIGSYDCDTKHWEVDTGAVKCTFFHGCMYPVWFRNSDGEEFPFFIFRDCIKLGGSQAFLDEERWATFTVVENTPLRFIIECRGNYCYGRAPFNRPASEVQAVYRYEFRRGSGDVRLKVTLGKPVGLECAVELCRLRWRYIRFERYGGLDIGRDLPYLSEILLEPASLRHPSMDLRLGEHKVYLLKEPYENKFLYLRDADGMRNWAADSAELQFETMLCFGMDAEKGAAK